MSCRRGNADRADQIAVHQNRIMADLSVRKHFMNFGVHLIFILFCQLLNAKRVHCLCKKDLFGEPGVSRRAVAPGKAFIIARQKRMIHSKGRKISGYNGIYHEIKIRCDVSDIKCRPQDSVFPAQLVNPVQDIKALFKIFKMHGIAIPVIIHHAFLIRLSKKPSHVAAASMVLPFSFSRRALARVRSFF